MLEKLNYASTYKIIQVEASYGMNPKYNRTETLIYLANINFSKLMQTTSI